MSSSGDIAISDTTNKCSIILNGAYCLKHVITGTDDNQLRFPLGVIYSNKDTLLVVAATIVNSKIQEFSSERGFLFSFRSKGSEDGQLLKPSKIAIDRINRVYAVDRGNFRVQSCVDGMLQAKFGTKGYIKDQIAEPYDVRSH